MTRISAHGAVSTSDKDENPEEFAKRIVRICCLYLRAIELKEPGTHVVCVDNPLM